MERKNPWTTDGGPAGHPKHARNRVHIHGSQKLFAWFGGHGLNATAGFMEQLGMPLPTTSAVLAGGAEFFGGIALLLGVGVRIASIPMTFTMLVARLRRARPRLQRTGRRDGISAHTRCRPLSGWTHRWGTLQPRLLPDHVHIQQTGETRVENRTVSVRRVTPANTTRPHNWVPPTLDAGAHPGTVPPRPVGCNKDAGQKRT